MYLPGFSSSSSRDADLADVVQPGCLADERRLGGIQPERKGQQFARAADALGVLAGRVVAVLRSECQPVEHLELRVLELARALRDPLVQEVVGAFQLDTEIAGLQEVADAQQYLADVDRLGQEIARAERECPALRVGSDVGSQHEHRHPGRLLGEERDLLEDLRPAAFGHVPVEQEQVGRFLRAARDDRQRIGHRLDGGVPGAGEHSLQEQGVGLLVVDHEDPRRVQQSVVHADTARWQA